MASKLHMWDTVGGVQGVHECLKCGMRRYRVKAGVHVYAQFGEPVIYNAVCLPSGYPSHADVAKQRRRVKLIVLNAKNNWLK